VAPAHAALFRLQIEQGRKQARDHPIPAADLPELVHAAVTGESAPLPLTGACLCVWLGADLFDNVLDEELADSWQEVGPMAATLIAVTFLALVWKTLGLLPGHGAPAERVAALVELFADRLLAMSSGEHADLAGPARLETADSIRIAEGKSGSQFALYARAGAILGGAGAEAADAYADYGARLGTASQVMSDLADVSRAPASDDLRNGALTLPVVHAMSSSGRERLEPLLRAARASGAAQAEVRAALIDAGAPAYVAGVAAEQRERGLADLARAGAAGPAAAELERLLDVGCEVELVSRLEGDSQAIADELRRQTAAR
jgi:geranylgeranyl pyrophosphate synthase